MIDDLVEKADPDPKETGPAKPWENKTDDVPAEPEGSAEGESEGDDEGGEARDSSEQAEAGEGRKPEPGSAGLDREQREQRVKAIRAFARDGFEDDEITKLEKTLGVETFLKRGLKLAGRQKTDDRAYNDLRTLKSGKKGAQGAPSENPADDSPGRSGTEVSEAAPGDAGRPLDRIDQLVEAGSITPEVADEIRAQHRSAEQRVQAAEVAAIQAKAESRFTAAMSELVEEFPGLKDEKRAAEVWAWIGANDPEMKYLNGPMAGFKKHVRDGCYIAFGPEIRDQARKSLTQRNNRARDNMPHPPGGSVTGGKPRALSQDDIDDLAFDAIANSSTQAEKDRKLAMIPRR